LVLRAALFGNDYQAAGRMPQPHRRAGLVAFLAAPAAGAIGIYLTLGQQTRIGQACPNGAAESRLSFQSGARVSFWKRAHRSPLVVRHCHSLGWHAPSMMRGA